ncbi:MAG: glycosyltransferase [Bacteroidota bacterium]|nr:glycosyltransferase [Bacteroidota bacterium]
MKILLVLGKYLPQKNGGIENYSHLLSTKLYKEGFTVEIALLESPEKEAYIFDNISVNILNGSFENFKKLLQKKEYNICHFQEYSAFGGIEMFWIKAAKDLCKKVFFTFHLPYFTCYKNDFRYFDVEDCSNFSSPERCVKCVIATRLHYKKSTRVNLINYGIELITPLIEKTNKIKLLKSNIRKNTNNLTELLKYCDNVFVIAKWFKKLLEYNGFTSLKIKYIPPISASLVDISPTPDVLKKKLVFIGRIEPQKGLLLLCKAMNKISTNGISLDVFGNKVDDRYFKKCETAHAFNFKGTIPRKELLSKLADYDFLILPSVFTEMFPLVIQEAFFDSLPVIASAAKGNVDVITDGKNGFIFEYGNYKDLARVIDKAYTLKKNGWKPVFETNDSHEKDLKEILSYYS